MKRVIRGSSDISKISKPSMIQADQIIENIDTESSDESEVYNIPYPWKPLDKFGSRFKYSDDTYIAYVSLSNSIADTDHITVFIFIISKQNADDAKEIKYLVHVDSPDGEWHTAAVSAMLRAKDEIRKLRRKNAV